MLSYLKGFSVAGTALNRYTVNVGKGPTGADMAHRAEDESATEDAPMRKQIFRAAALMIAMVWLAASIAMGASGSGESGGEGGPPTTTTTTTTNTTNVDRGTINVGTLYQGSVSVSGAMSASVVYTWGQLRATNEMLNALNNQVNGTARTALNFYRNAVGSLPSNAELLTATAPFASPFLYYSTGNTSGFEYPTSITDGANALGIENKVIGGRTYRWSSSVSGPSNQLYAISHSTSSSTSTTSNVMAGDFVVGTNTDVVTTNTNYSGTAQLSVYEVSGSKYVSPIVLDLKGMGKLEASGGNHLPHPGKLYKDRVIAFDFNANGFEVMMEWVGPNDGLLIEPKADGTIDGSCLFGTTGGFLNGYEKLAVRDANGDKKLNGAELAGLKVWQDRNGNGRADEREVASIEDLKITEMGLNHKNFQSTFTMNGATRVMWDWWPSAMEVKKVRVADIQQ
jgi:hypothetical protein